VVRSVLYLQPKEGDHRAVVDFYRRHEILGRAVGESGCRTSELHVPSAGSGPLLVTALWDGPAAYHRWLENDFRRRRAGELAALLDDTTGGLAGQLYEVVLSADAERAEGG
jgi:Antibiotic biosynthesis monooxygenase